MSHQLPRWEKAGYPLPSSVSVGLRWEPRSAWCARYPSWLVWALRAPHPAHALQPWVCLELTVPGSRSRQWGPIDHCG